jgi:hypothetical protein
MSEAGPCGCAVEPACLQNECDGNNQKSVHHGDLVLKEIFSTITFVMTLA